MQRTKIRWGILSTANIARNTMVPAIQNSSNSEVLAVASRTIEKAEAFAKEKNIPRSYSSYEELLADTEIDAIYNCLPISYHAEWAIKCAEAGKSVLVEKPIASNLVDAKKMYKNTRS